MSGSIRRRHSKWDYKDSEALAENFDDRGHPRKPREPVSPSRGSRRHESRSKERMTWDREGNGGRMSPGLDEWRHRHHSRSPRNSWSRSYRSSRSRSRSQSPAHNFRREPMLNDRSRNKSGASAQTCRDFAAGRCRRGSHCPFLHQDAQPFDSRRPLDCSSPDDWDNSHRRSGGSRYSPDDAKDYSLRSEKSLHICSDFLKGKCRRGASCRNVHHEAAADVSEKGPIDDVYRDRDHDHRSRDTYPHRNHDREPPRRGETVCKFFASGNCRNGNRCRFSHQVREGFSPEKRSEDDKQHPDHKFEDDQVWHGARWDDMTTGSDVPPVQGWGEPEDKNDITEVAKEVTRARSGDGSWSHDMLNIKQTWDAPPTIDEPRVPDAQLPFQWMPESSVPATDLSASRGAENFSGGTEISPRDIKQHGVSSLNTQNPPLLNISLPAAHQDTAGKTSYEKPYPVGFQDQRVYSDPFSGQNPSYKEDKRIMYPGEGRNVVGNDDGSCIIPTQPMNVPPVQGIFQTEQSINVLPISGINPSGGQCQPPFPSNSSGGQGRPPFPLNTSGGGGIQISHHPPFFHDSKVADGGQVVDATSSALATETAARLSTVSSEQLVKLSHITANLAQLLESRQQLPQSSSAVTSLIMSSLPDSAASIPPVVIQPNKALETLKQYDPICDSIEANMPNLGNQMLPSGVEQKNNNELNHEGGNMKQQEPPAAANDDENGRKTAEESSKAPEYGPSEDMAVDDGADDGKKSKDTKVIRPFKFALAEFVKELLKPSWKDGHVNKEAYKTIVKKVVDKIIETQGLQIPQTKEKIDQYLSCSKQKIDKLVQAYVGKFQKS